MTAYITHNYTSLPKEIGRTRTVYLDADWVYKVPRNSEGYLANYLEARHYAKQTTATYIPIAECYLIENDVLKMRRAQACFDDYDSLPDWVGAVDCAQVGYVDGRLVAYDL